MKIIAHRGLHYKYKQNTKEALLEALNTDYIDGIELDIRMTKDKKLVIIHDPIINFVSNGSGLVSNMKYKKLLKYNFGTKENPSKILLLEKFLNSIKTDKVILIDIKSENKNLEIANRLINIIKKINLNIYITSFNYEIIKYLKDYNVGLLIGLSINKKRLYNHFAFNIVHINYYERINKRKKTFIWGIKDLKDLNKINYNTYVITDDPFKVYELIDGQLQK